MSNNPLHPENADYANKTDDEIIDYLIANDSSIAGKSREEIAILVPLLRRLPLEDETEESGED